jgi:hypothetical protein
VERDRGKSRQGERGMGRSSQAKANPKKRIAKAKVRSERPREIKGRGERGAPGDMGGVAGGGVLTVAAPPSRTR